MALALAACGLAGCSAPKARTSGGPFAAPAKLTAAIVGDGDVDMRWRNDAPEAAGQFIEFKTVPEEEFTLLDAVGPDTCVYRHRDLAPETRFIYRVRPYFGRASRVVHVTTGPTPPEGSAPDLGQDGPLEPSGPVAEMVSGASLRARSAAAAATPADLSAALSSATSVDFRWRDRALDEDGYLVEAALDPGGAFRIYAFLPPGATSFRKSRLPPGTRCSFRVRAFFYGKPSNLAAVLTPPEPGDQTRHRR